MQAGEVRVLREDSGSIFVDKRDVKLIEVKPRGPAAGSETHPVMLRPTLEELAAWERAAGDQPVSPWVSELADRAAKWRP